MTSKRKSMKNHIPQAVTDWVANFSNSDNRYKVTLLGKYKGESAYYVYYEVEEFGGDPIVLLYDGVKCKRAINPFKILDYFP